MNRVNRLLAIGCSLLAIFINSCKQDTGSVGANILPSSDLISAYESDTTTILTSMYLKDSVPTNAVSSAVLGSYRDPIFGEVKASVFALVFSPAGSTTIPWNGQYTTSKYLNCPINADTGAVDSAVLLIPIGSTGSSSYYGTPGPETFAVYQSNHTISSDSASYSNTPVKYNPSPIVALQQVTPNPANNDTIRIKLSGTWLTSILNSMDNHPTYYSPSFDSLVKALYITVSNPLQLPGQGCIYYLNLQASFSGIYVYYHSIPSKSGLTVHQPEYYIVLPLGGNSNNYTYFSHIDMDHSSAPYGGEHPSGINDSISADNLVYVQNLGGPIGRINFPNFYQNWSKKSPVVINKAELDFTVDAQDCPNPYIPPAGIYLYGTDKNGKPYLLPDENNSITNFYDGSYNSFSNTYTFNITQYIQKVVQHVDTDRGLFIIPAYRGISANRVVLYGAQHNVAAPSANRMKLKIFYTPLPKTHKAEKH